MWHTWWQVFKANFILDAVGAAIFVGILLLIAAFSRK